MQNLYKEIVDILKDHNKTINDIKFISMDISESWTESNIVNIDINNFLSIAKTTNYDDGYGGTEIPEDLKIVGDNWWLERHEYDGSEWFEFKTLPNKPTKTVYIDRIKKEW